MTVQRLATHAATDTQDAATLVKRWEAQQEVYVAERESSFDLMLDIVEWLGLAPGRVVDLGCGPGSLASRAMRRWPEAEILGVDLDPVLVELGRRTLGERVTWVEADLREPSWGRLLGRDPVDAVISATAMHWLDVSHLRELAKELATHLRPNGVFLNYDTMALEDDVPRLRALSEQFRTNLAERARISGGADSWDGWWTMVRDQPWLADAVSERTRRFGTSVKSPAPSLEDYSNALYEAGFQEVATLKQVANRRLLVAIR